MPIKLDTQLPALEILRSENVFIMDNERANIKIFVPWKF